VRRKLYLEDLAVGRSFRGGPITLELSDLTRFAREYDPQYFHTDPDAAKASIFGGLVGSGWQTAALTMRMLIQDSATFADGLVGLGGDLAWSRPVRPGDTLRAIGEVTKIAPSRSRPDRGVVTMDCRTVNQRDEIVLTLKADLLVFARGGRA
jgi:acyl dehydratase